MIFSVKDISNGFNKKIEFEEKVLIPKSEFIDSNVRVCVNGTLTNNNDKYEFVGEVKAFLKLNCCNCLKEIKKELIFSMEEIFVKGNSNNDEVFVISSKDSQIDFTDSIVANILLNLPMKEVCIENCKGLCSFCGQNLNEFNCNCNKEYINPKFQEILKMFNEKEEV